MEEPRQNIEARLKAAAQSRREAWKGSASVPPAVRAAWQREVQALHGSSGKSDKERGWSWWRLRLAMAAGTAVVVLGTSLVLWRNHPRAPGTDHDAPKVSSPQKELKESSQRQEQSSPEALTLSLPAPSQAETSGAVDQLGYAREMSGDTLAAAPGQVWYFVNTTPTPTSAAKLKRDNVEKKSEMARAQASSQILQRFSLQRSGTNLVFLDQDGSQYTGAMLPMAEARATSQTDQFASGPAAPAGSSTLANSPALRGGGVGGGLQGAATNAAPTPNTFYAYGTNQTLGRKVQVSGYLLLPNFTNQVTLQGQVQVGDAPGQPIQATSE